MPFYQDRMPQEGTPLGGRALMTPRMIREEKNPLRYGTPRTTARGMPWRGFGGAQVPEMGIGAPGRGYATPPTAETPFQRLARGIANRTVPGRGIGNRMVDFRVPDPIPNPPTPGPYGPGTSIDFPTTISPRQRQTPQMSFADILGLLNALGPMFGRGRGGISPFLNRGYQRPTYTPTDTRNLIFPDRDPITGIKIGRGGMAPRFPELTRPVTF